MFDLQRNLNIYKSESSPSSKGPARQSDEESSLRRGKLGPDGHPPTLARPQEGEFHSASVDV